MVRLLPPADPVLCLDVGANIGTFSERLSNALPTAQIYVFVPIPTTFYELEARMKRFPRVSPVQLALGDRNGNATMELMPQSGWNRVINDLAKMRDVSTTSVKMMTIDDFCDSGRIKRISLLKTDCEGYDKQSNRCAHKQLAAGHIDAVYCEVNFRRDGRHGDFFSLHKRWLAIALSFSLSTIIPASLPC